MGWRKKCRILGFYAVDREWLKYCILFKYTRNEKRNRTN